MVNNYGPPAAICEWRYPEIGFYTNEEPGRDDPGRLLKVRVRSLHQTEISLFDVIWSCTKFQSVIRVPGGMRGHDRQLYSNSVESRVTCPGRDLSIQYD